jgi:hypothetical protein
MVMANKEGPEYDQIGEGGLVWTGDGTIEYLAIRDGTIYRVKQGR